MIMMKKLLLLIPVMLLAACAHIKPPPPEMYTQVDNCYENVRLGIQSDNSAKVQRLANASKSSNELTLPMMVMAEAMAKMASGDPFASCVGSIVSHNQAEAQAVTSVNQTIRTGIGIGGGVLIADTIADGLVNLAGNPGSTVIGSRVVNNSNRSSASGDFLGIGTNNGGKDAIGGFQPRALIAEDIGTAPSQSGTNAPSNGQDNAVPLPAAE